MSQEAALQLTFAVHLLWAFVRELGGVCFQMPCAGTVAIRVV